MDEDIIREIQQLLFELRDEKYQKFQSSLIPGMDKKTMIGVRTPFLKKEANRLLKREDIGIFLNNLPHKYFEENQLHAFMIAQSRKIEQCMDQVNVFLPYIDNWATCDQLNPAIFKKNKELLLENCKVWIKAEEEYTVRFGIKMLMDHFLEKDFKEEYGALVAKLQREEYYIKMMAAWYFATALAKQYHCILPYFEENRLDVWVHNKAIQKAVESNRINRDTKEYLKTLRRYSEKKTRGKQREKR